MTKSTLDAPGSPAYLARKAHNINGFISNGAALLEEQVYGDSRNDAMLGVYMAGQHGMRLSPSSAKAYDVTKYPITGELHLTGENRDAYIRYLLRIGAVSRDTNLVPAQDGMNHINIYSKSRCIVGRMLSNFYSLPDGADFLTLHGAFKTLEGYYHYLRLLDYALLCRSHKSPDKLTDFELMKMHGSHRGVNYDVLRTMDGGECIREGRRLKAIAYGDTRYKPGAFSKRSEGFFRWAVLMKLGQIELDGSPLIMTVSDYVYSGIPFLHYYMMDGKVVTPKHNDWLPSVMIWAGEQVDPNGLDCDIWSITEQVESDYGLKGHTQKD